MSIAKPSKKWKGYEGIDCIYISDFGLCFYAESLDEAPSKGEGMRYYGTEDGFNVYGTDVQGINKYLPNDSVEFWAIPTE